MGRLPSTVEVLSRLNQKLTSDQAALESVCEVIAADEELVKAILKLANSAYYGGSGSVENLDEALQRLGFREMYKICISFAVRDLFQTDLPSFHLSASDFWSLSLAAALTMERLAGTTGEASGLTYAVGLLHRVGLCAGQRYEHSTNGNRRKAPHRRARPTVEWQQRTGGVGFPEVGAALLRKWKFPPQVYVPVLFQLDPLAAPLEHRRLASQAHIALLVAERLVWPGGSQPFDELSDLHPVVLEADLPPKVLPVVFTMVGHLLGETRALYDSREEAVEERSNGFMKLV